MTCVTGFPVEIFAEPQRRLVTMTEAEELKRKNREKVARWRAANPDRAREHAIRSALASRERREASGQGNFRNGKSRIKNTKRMTDAEWRALQEARRVAREAFARMSPEEQIAHRRANVRERVRRHRERQMRGIADIDEARARADQKIAGLRAKREAARQAKKNPG